MGVGDCGIGLSQISSIALVIAWFCSLRSAILLPIRNKDSTNEALYPVSSTQYICRTVAMRNPGKIYCMICIESTAGHGDET